MKRILSAMFVTMALSSGALADKACKFSDVGKLKEHLEKHVTYPATGKAIKAACLKEAPEEFTSAERSCTGKKLKDAVSYQNAADVEKALGVE